MSKTKLKQIVSQLTKEQQQSLAEIVSRRKTQQLEPSDIAIIGLSGRYPQADNHYDFWNKVQQRTNFIQEVPVSRWDHSDYYDPQVNKSFVPHKTRCKFGAFLNAYDQFDASFFDLHPGEVSGMDPQERLALETSWSCIEDAGYVPSMLDKEVGIFSGLTYGEYQKIIPITTHFCMLNNRIAYFFNFQGPTVTTDAGCSSSLTAIHLACQSLIRKECQTAIVIGANVILHPDHYTSLSPGLSPTAHPFSNPFGTDDGWIPAEGVVSILLKPLRSALQSRDHIYAVIILKSPGYTRKPSAM
jgi:acyl transferase domain-containing protein